MTKKEAWVDGRRRVETPKIRLLHNVYPVDGTVDIVSIYLHSFSIRVLVETVDGISRRYERW